MSIRIGILESAGDDRDRDRVESEKIVERFLAVCAL